MLKLAAANKFDVLITNDRGLEYEQNLQTLPLAVVVILAKSNTIEDVRLLCGQLRTALDVIQPC